MHTPVPAPQGDPHHEAGRPSVDPAAAAVQRLRAGQETARKQAEAEEQRRAEWDLYLYQSAPAVDHSFADIEDALLEVSLATLRAVGTGVGRVGAVGLPLVVGRRLGLPAGLAVAAGELLLWAGAKGVGRALRSTRSPSAPPAGWARTPAPPTGATPWLGPQVQRPPDPPPPVAYPVEWGGHSQVEPRTTEGTGR